MKKTIPTFETDQQAQEFVDTASLAEYDMSGGTSVKFEFEAKSAHINMRVPQPLLDAVKERARVRGIPYTRFIRHLIEREVLQPGKPRP
ncbi:CopG family antitoxin [Rhodopila sp.]|uniref:CopG family antitoxin n=1 Tax=Rhodopila sp. TaxID=2480087 RepID=UPI003D12CCD1